MPTAPIQPGMIRLRMFCKDLAMDGFVLLPLHRISFRFSVCGRVANIPIMDQIVISTRASHLSVGWEVGVVCTFVVVIITLLTVVICQYNRRKARHRGIELENGTRSYRNGPMAATSTSKRKKRRRNKTRKTKVRDPDVTINANDLGSDEIEEIVDFDEVMVPLEMNVGTGGVSGSQQHVDIPEPTRCESNSFETKNAQPKSIPTTDPPSNSTTMRNPAVNHFQEEPPS